MLPRAALLLLIVAASASGQTAQRRLTTIDAIRQFPGYFHLQNVLLRGELSDDAERLALRADEGEIRITMGDGVSTQRGPVEVRGYVIDVGRLDQDDPRLGTIAQGRDRERWPRPGEELFVRVTSLSDASVASSPTVRAVALEPWKYEGQTITLVGNFRGRNLFGDMPAAPAKSKYDFVLRGAEGAIWVTGLRPRGRSFELDVDRRIDSDRWVSVMGTIVHEKGLVMLEGTTLTLAKAPEVQTPPVEADVPALPKPPVEVIFNSPTEAETDVRPTETVRIQFSRGLNEKSLQGRTRVTLVGATADDPGVVHKAVYDIASRSIALRFDAPLPSFRTVKVEILEGMTGFDGAAVTPWTLTFSIGG
jgi:hypothetical protein